MQPSKQSLQGALLALGNHLNIAVAQVADKARQLQIVRPFLHEVPHPHALHASLQRGAQALPTAQLEPCDGADLPRLAGLPRCLGQLDHAQAAFSRNPVGAATQDGIEEALLRAAALGEILRLGHLAC